MKTSTLEVLIWVLLYGGLLGGVTVGLAVKPQNEALGLTLCIGGGVAAALGVLLIWVRSRLRP